MFPFFELAGVGTHSRVRVGMLRQERFQDALRERLDLGNVRDARIGNRRQTMSISAKQSQLRGGGRENQNGVFLATRLVRVTPVVSTSSTYLSTSLTGSTGALHEMKITARMWGKKAIFREKRSSAA
jgi:hypothetical protein